LIKKMGSKIEAKTVAIEAGVPVVPGYHSPDQSDTKLIEAAAKIGVPLMIKASAGGGGRGMRLVVDLSEFEAELGLARKEAEAAFGDPAVLLERYVENARHIEVQVLGDRYGNTIHLFERDCSIQRNHQKIIEEAPAPNLPENVRSEMLSAAIDLSERVGYDSAGTVEFIYDTNRQEFYFLEMNTRLQVEHPVTEAITGIDLVQWQIRIAMDEALTLKQDDVQCSGWALEARVAAENPEKNYLPQTGHISNYQSPELEDVRLDSGIAQGSLVSHYYDNMLAKVIAHAPNRNSAVRKLKHALEKFEISGVGTNKNFLIDILSLHDFVVARHHTGTLSVNYPAGWKATDITSLDQAVAVLAGYLAKKKSVVAGPWGRNGAWRITQGVGVPATSHFALQDAVGATHDIEILEHADTYTVNIGGEPVASFCNVSMNERQLTFEHEGQVRSVTASVQGDRVLMSSNGKEVEIQLLRSEQVYLSGKGSSASGGNQVYAPMPGLIVDVLVAKGQSVEMGEPVIILEAMKLLQKLEAPASGVVKEIGFNVGDTPEKGAVLLTIDPETQSS